MEELKKLKRNIIIMLTIIFISFLFLSGYSFNLSKDKASVNKTITTVMNL